MIQEVPIEVNFLLLLLSLFQFVFDHIFSLALDVVIEMFLPDRNSEGLNFCLRGLHQCGNYKIKEGLKKRV
jgi:hypothetical protein